MPPGPNPIRASSKQVPPGTPGNSLRNSFPMNDSCLTSPLLTDLYELTMAAAYLDQEMDATATFSLFLRPQPRRGYFVAAGVDPAMEWLSQLAFDPQEIEYLRSTSLFKSHFLDYLQTLRFTGSVRALPEGTIFFPDEPILEVTAPLIQAQLVETYLINTIGIHSLIATKAARCVHAARGRGLIDFALRRTQGADAGMAAARSSYLAGFDATSNVLAGRRYGIPVAGTMAHSFVQSFPSEAAAFHAYAQTFPRGAIFLIDTYDTLSGAHEAAAVAQAMAQEGRQLVGVRLDSGDCTSLSHEVRRILDGAGLAEVKIFASGGYDEYGIADALARNAAIDAFGVGTRMGVSADQPFLDLAYKLVRYDGKDVRKLSTSKQSMGGAKQVFRRTGADGTFAGDVIATTDDVVANARPLMISVMQQGKNTGIRPGLADIRDYFRRQWASLPETTKDLYYPAPYPVAVSPNLTALQRRIDAQLAMGPPDA